MTQLRIAILCYPTFGGSGVLATELAESLAERGHTIHLLSYATPSRLQGYTPNLSFHQVEVSSYPLFKYPSYDLALTAKLVEIAQEHGLDLIHAHYAIPHSISAILASDILASPHLRVVTTLHGTDITLLGSEENYGPLIHYTLKHSDAVTAVSCFLADASRRTCCPNTPITVIPNFVDLLEFRPATRSVIPHDPPRFIHISNFRPVKRVLDIVRVFREIRRERPASLTLVGEGPDLGQARSLVRTLDLQNDVDFVGQQTDVASILQDMDIFLLTSETESFGLSALEALACGVPAVCMNVGGLSEVVEDGVSGGLTPDGDIYAMARTCLDLLANPDRLRTMTQAARQRASLFGKEEIVDRYVSFYHETLARRP
ncbi:MAG: N-acetyl-alpha-D-glucosaminyl L-malate synthase BshA [Planctomycetes bacterium]|nr:N-acetyl-alpha-D-glucosaminyl L-malate synthase BshA [Planctomycetota bacterium]